MANYWAEFSFVAGAHLLAVASPGPDFAIVLKQSISHGLRTAVWTSIGIGAAILLHVTYSVLGIGLVVRSSEFWFTVLKYAGAAYLAWLGARGLRARAPRRDLDGQVAIATAELPADRGAFAIGFLTNALNVKAMLFFVTLFAVFVSPQTPKPVQVGYGAWMAVATAAWFCLVAVLFTRVDVRQRFLRYGHWINRALGVVFIAFAVRLALASVAK